MPIEWHKCFLCQQNTAEKLQTPALDGYNSIVSNLLQFRQLNEVPVDIDFTQLDNEGDIEQTLVSNQAKCHKSCRLKINNTKLERIKRRRSENVQMLAMQLRE